MFAMLVPRRPAHPHWRSLAALLLASTLGYCVAPYPARATKKPAACPYRRTAR